MDDSEIHQHIDQLVANEHALREKRAQGRLTRAEEHDQLAAAETQLDRLWDLLRQRQARREFGADPDQAEERPASTVENYRS